MNEPNKRGGAGRGQGRKRILASEILRLGSIRLTETQWEKFKSLGGVSWVRSQINDHEDITNLRKDNQELQRESKVLQLELLLAKQKLANFKRMREKPLRQPTPISPDTVMLDRLIRLCHPDKHGGSPVSNEVTTWLLGQRTKK